MFIFSYSFTFVVFIFLLIYLYIDNVDCSDAKDIFFLLILFHSKLLGGSSEHILPTLTSSFRSE